MHADWMASHLYSTFPFFPLSPPLENGNFLSLQRSKKISLRPCSLFVLAQMG